MDQQHIRTVIRALTGTPSRRHLLRGLAAVGLGWGVGRLPESAAAKKQRKDKPKKRKGLCRKDGTRCTRPGKNCKQTYCLSAPFTIEASWAETADQEVYLFVPPQNAATGPAPHVYSFCNSDNSRCEETYPFACVNDDSTTGPEIITIHQLLPGKYEYWVELFSTTPAGEVTVVLKDSNDRIVRRWTNPANPAAKQAGWHVFDVDGRDGRIAAIDELLAPVAGLPDDAHDPYTLVCP